ncbi:hypothetical protein [Streptomyces chartreusis]|uniref:hypothetical protein n=1 Tax=Streptomyces chartreusis TaxID=1969 RepID=UPI0037DCA20D|nr:hypothetical protein OG938_48175 [Streptomyces chartreusis]WTA33873.1 hypothetical protein OIA45_48540 [Streptomyces chartreusis]
MPNNAAVQAEIDARRAALIKLRRVRTPYDSPEILNLGYTSADVARKDFYRAVTARRKATEAEVADYREEQNEILESLLDTYLPIALGADGDAPDPKVAKLVLETLERQAKVNGWEAALKAELSGPGGGGIPVRAETLNELRNLIRTAGDPDEDEDDLPGDTDGDPDDDGDNA